MSARTQWNQHAYYVTNVDDDGEVGYGAPNYPEYNSFRTQAPGSFGSFAASDVYPVASACQSECGDLSVWVQGANSAAFIGAREDLLVRVYGVSGGSLELLDEDLLPWRIDAGEVTDGIEFVLDVADWTRFDNLKVTLDEPDGTSDWGGAQECDEDDNSAVVNLADFCE